MSHLNLTDIAQILVKTAETNTNLEFRQKKYTSDDDIFALYGLLISEFLPFDFSNFKVFNTIVNFMIFYNNEIYMNERNFHIYEIIKHRFSIKDKILQELKKTYIVDKDTIQFIQFCTEHSSIPFLEYDKMQQLYDNIKFYNIIIPKKGIVYVHLFTYIISKCLEVDDYETIFKIVFLYFGVTSYMKIFLKSYEFGNTEILSLLCNPQVLEEWDKYVEYIQYSKEKETFFFSILHYIPNDFVQYYYHKTSTHSCLEIKDADTILCTIDITQLNNTVISNHLSHDAI